MTKLPEIAALNPGEPAPPFGSKRSAAMEIYTPPFRFHRGYIFDAQNHMVSDDKGVVGAVVARVRGWGRIGYRPNGAEIQDEIGQMIADALNAYYTAPPAQTPPPATSDPLRVQLRDDWRTDDWGVPIIYDTDEVDEVAACLTGDEGEDDSLTVLRSMAAYVQTVWPGKTALQVLTECEESTLAAPPAQTPPLLSDDAIIEISKRLGWWIGESDIAADSIEISRAIEASVRRQFGVNE